MGHHLPISLVIPTVGRTELLRDCLSSVAGGTALPAEVVLVDQSRGDALAPLIADLPSLPIRRVASGARNIAVAYNVGIQAAREAIVAVTHDDCTVAADWLEVALRTVASRTDLLATGRVLPEGDADLVPSCKTSEEPREYCGELEVSLLFPANFVAHRSELLAIGGFDEAFARAAEDGDLCFRWLGSGRTLRYEPGMTVWHRDWRSRDELLALNVRYAFDQGRMYGKHLWRRDWAIAPFVARDAREAVRLMRAQLLRRPVAMSDWRRGLARGLPAGVVVGLAQQAQRSMRRVTCP
ncbi:glycosyltransferase family 2 protein [Capillimicrobium parvum]|uniref:glycosyltransferase family 2 protein n=1 Tax=Capillimicrobium parvum TaxID=2884022 RepID=UPI00216AFD49|nr:glycosyltransferase [Capillimicrobium parvum]